MSIKRISPKKTVATLTPERRAVLDAIRAYRRATGRLPSFADVAEAVGIVRRTARDHAKSLMDGGYVHYIKGEHRSLIVTRKGQRVPDLLLAAKTTKSSKK